ncbi:unnamed protein product, partial [Phaeothamnion confervicola]
AKRRPTRHSRPSWSASTPSGVTGSGGTTIRQRCCGRRWATCCSWRRSGGSWRSSCGWQPLGSPTARDFNGQEPDICRRFLSKLGVRMAAVCLYSFVRPSCVVS